jgi:ferric-dicitrate binding protein FerR (iron transport regulator)
MNKELFNKYFRGNTSLEEEKEILDWVDVSKENREILEKERLLFDITLFALDKKTKRNKIIPIIKLSLRVAAAILVIFSCTYLLKEYRINKMIEMQTITVPSGQRAQITLTDGTKVWLNSKSTLSYASNFGRINRNIELDGEAYFEVTKNKKLPFCVKTEYNKVEVVGTHFNICAYHGSDNFEATLVEGIVDIYQLNSNKVTTRLTKNEYYIEKSGKFSKTKLSSLDFLHWRDGLYCFDDMPFSEMMNKLEKYYNVQIIVHNSSIINYRCTGKFNEQDGIVHILKVIQKDHPFTFNYNKANRCITIK